MPGTVKTLQIVWLNYDKYVDGIFLSIAVIYRVKKSMSKKIHIKYYLFHDHDYKLFNKLRLFSMVNMFVGMSYYWIRYLYCFTILSG